ncbi:TSUP family transporter [Kineosporia sp. J2-2]|uniref:Probable membrane transporter protein n=1 Tax=Kineosporia corallincola TaxID=2835133 RepID=A0ABS5TRF1_9ACTN|nr:TSUP family transporter [Kineosporia corallincola]MBT0773371.1 TSUP family transporter [Kineosporia corallincola]
MFFPPDLGPEALVLLLLAAFAAGWVDAVVGGGGLLQLPALLLVPGLSPVQVLATNKLGSIFGTATSSITYYRRAKPDLRTALPMAAVALVGSFAGASIASALPVAVFKPVIVVALLVVAGLTLAKPALGQSTALRYAGRAHYRAAVAIGLAVGVYDGVLGPGTGTFLVMAMVGIVGYDFLQASAKAKIVNFATNLGALLFFVPTGSVVWGLGVLLGVANLSGGYLGARMAVSSGTRFIRTVFLVVVLALIVKVSHDVWVENWG